MPKNVVKPMTRDGKHTTGNCTSKERCYKSEEEKCSKKLEGMAEETYRDKFLTTTLLLFCCQWRENN